MNQERYPYASQTIFEDFSDDEPEVLEVATLPFADSLALEAVAGIDVLESSEDFDLGLFFSTQQAAESELDTNLELTETEENTGQRRLIEPELLLTLRNDADEAITTVSSKITAETFAVGSSLTATVFSSLGSLIGSCGLFCAHSISSIAQAGSTGLPVASSLQGLSMPGFNVDGLGNFHLEGNIDSLAKATGLSKADLIQGKFSAEEILLSFFNAFGQGISMLFGFGLIDCVMDSIFPESLTQ